MEYDVVYSGGSEGRWKAYLVASATEGAMEAWTVVMHMEGDSRVTAGRHLLQDLEQTFARMDGVCAGTQGNRVMRRARGRGRDDRP
jgi:hypothetical protein